MVWVDQIDIENFRSIEKLSVKLHRMNALIGPNNAGKSNIIKALSLVLGETYPSVRTFEENHFYGKDTNKAIKIDVIFNDFIFEPRSSNEVYGFRLECKNGDVEYVCLDKLRQPLKYRTGTPVRVSQDLRDEIPLIFLDIDRQSAQQIKATQWTLYGKILKHLGKQIPDTKKDQFYKDVSNSFNSEIFSVSPGSDLKSLEDQLKKTIKDYTGFDLTLELSVLDPIEAIKSVRPFVKEGTSTQKFDPEEMGAGTQSALTVSIARAYSEIVKKSVLLAIEEPEIHFHPQACRNMYNTFIDLSKNGLQIFYTTHSQSFVDISDFDSLHIVRKNGGKTNIESGIKLSANGTFTSNRLLTKFNEHVNQSLFADHVVLVEGPDDEIACKSMLEKLGLDIFKENISITSCAGLQNVPSISKVLHALNIDTIALVDEDPGNSKTQSARTEIEHTLGINNVFLQSPKLEGVFGQTQKFDQARALTFFNSYTGPVPQIYSDIMNRLT